MSYRLDFSRQLVLWLQRDGLLADSWDVQGAADFVNGLLSPYTYEYLALERGWTEERFVAQLRAVLRCALVKDYSGFR